MSRFALIIGFIGIATTGTLNALDYKSLPEYTMLTQLTVTLQNEGWKPPLAGLVFTLSDPDIDNGVDGGYDVELLHPTFGRTSLFIVREGSFGWNSNMHTELSAIMSNTQRQNHAPALWDEAAYSHARPEVGLGGSFSIRKGPFMLSVTCDQPPRKFEEGDILEVLTKMHRACVQSSAILRQMQRPTPTWEEVDAITKIVIAMDRQEIPRGDPSPWLSKYLAPTSTASKGLKTTGRPSESEVAGKVSAFDWRTTLLAASLIVFGAAIGIWLLRRYAGTGTKA